jgi:hypothetical protein
MKTPRAALIAILSSTACTQAFAVPIVFEFTGSITGRYTQVVSGELFSDETQNGVAYSASLTIDSDLLQSKPVYNDYGYKKVQEYVDPEFSTPAVVGSLTLGSEVIDLRPYSGNAGNVAFGDSLGAIGGCNPQCDGLGDSLAINANSRAPDPTSVAAGLTGSSRVLSFGAYEDWDLFDPTKNGNLFSLDGLSVDQLVSMSLPNAYLSYSDVYWSCGGTSCVQAPSTTTTFSIDTMTRRVASVPEPGTLALFALGLFGVAGVRRRRLQA